MNIIHIKTRIKHMNHQRIRSCLLAAPLLLASCIAEDFEYCPDGRAIVKVLDTEYENADEVARAMGISRADDTLPIGATLNSMVVIHHDRETDDYVSRDVAVSETDPNHYLENAYFNAEGHNAVMLIGNDHQSASDYPPLDQDNGRMSDITVDLDSDEEERPDIFIGRGIVSVPMAQDTVIWMQRATGKLIVQIQNLPNDITRAALHIDNVATDVDWNLNYSGNMPTVHQAFDMDVDVDVNNMEVNLPPNFEGETSPVTVILREGDDAVTLPAVPVVMKRNRITLLQLNYDDITGTWEFRILVDGKWERIETLSLPDDR